MDAATVAELRLHDVRLPRTRAVKASEEIIVFDLGGTWFRSALYHPGSGTLRAVSKHPALNYVSHPRLDVATLQEKTLQYILEKVRLLSNEIPSRVSVSFGGAINGNNQVILDAAPLWGPSQTEFDLRRALTRHLPEYEWNIVNDVTAMLLRHVHDLALDNVRKVALLTVSSGIAARVFDVEQRRIELDKYAGLQGEIGHVPVNFVFNGRPYQRRCDCGGLNHLNAFSSGRGLFRLLQIACGVGEVTLPGTSIEAPVPTDEVAAMAGFRRGLKLDSPGCRDLLRSSVAPLAQQILTIISTDPLIEKVILTGGCVHQLEPFWLETLKKLLEDMGLYQVSRRTPNFWDDVLTVGKNDDASGLVGAALSLLPLGGRHLERLPTGPQSWRVRGAKQSCYVVRQVNGLLDPGNRALVDAATPRRSTGRFFVLVDQTVDSLFGKRIRAYFDHHSERTCYCVCESGEKNKHVREVLKVCELIDQFGLDRRAEPIIAFGGGVLLDIAGFAASIYRRGTPYIRVPTTLMAYIDAGVGIKTGVNVGRRKNRLGSYHAPIETLLDSSFLTTLPDRHLRNGLAEVVKVAVVRDGRLFRLLERPDPAEVLGDFRQSPPGMILDRSIDGMLEELAGNLWEDNLERLMDFGHTFSPDIELSTEPHLLHGEAVAIDMALCALIAMRRGLLRESDAKRIIDLLCALGLPIFHPVCESSLFERSLISTTHHRGGLQRISLPVGIGEAVFVNDVSISEVCAAARDAEALQRRPA